MNTDMIYYIFSNFRHNVQQNIHKHVTVEVHGMIYIINNEIMKIFFSLVRKYM